MKKIMMLGLAACLSAGAIPSAALAGDEDQARVAISAAKAKLDAAEKAGVGGNAGDILNRSRTALEAANKEFRDDEDRFARLLAQQAEALADLAAATSEMRALESEQSKIAAVN